MQETCDKGCPWALASPEQVLQAGRLKAAFALRCWCCRTLSVAHLLIIAR
ncbi:hypothetical protein NLK61_17635 [Pseudomonas fuscovaginae UPB0736]|nr:hypothetical protein [Pseudomonas fuscovaginae]UUQ63102.1 hypothetical protein NLK61_17635 [Pseudomonas fuscovaginae UPB0736]